MKRLIMLLAFMFAMFAVAPMGISAHAQEADATCSDGLDNDNDGLIDAADPSCTGLSEAPAVTVAPTAQPTAEPTPVTTEPATQAATPTPSAFPDTGGDPGTGSAADQQAVDFTTFETQTGLIGLLVTLLVTLLTISGITLSSKAKQLAALLIGIVAAGVFVSLRDGVALDDPNAVGAAIFTVLVASQAGYLLADKLLKAILPTTTAYKNSQN